MQTYAIFNKTGVKLTEGTYAHCEAVFTNSLWAAGLTVDDIEIKAV